MPSDTSLGRLAIVPPREVWPHEDHDFTPWLLGNVDVLSDLLGMDLVLEAVEQCLRLTARESHQSFGPAVAGCPAAGGA